MKKIGHIQHANFYFLDAVISSQNISEGNKVFKTNAGKDFSCNNQDLRLTESLWLKIKLEKVNNKEVDGLKKKIELAIKWNCHCVCIMLDCFILFF